MHTSRDQRRLLYVTVALVAAVTLVRMAVLRASPIELYPDEAQYWWWAQTPSFGYFSKPPLIAWIIRATTFLFGDREWAIRLGIPILHAGTSLLIFALARLAYPEDRACACWSALAYLTVPGVSYSSGQASTDAPLLFFWALASFAFVRAIQTGGWRWPLALGVATGLGFIAKYAMLFFVPGALVAAALVPEIRKFLASRRGITSLLVAVLVAAPNLVWNVSHGFATLGHTESNAHWAHASFDPRELLSFLASQFGVFGPVLMAAWFAAVRHISTDAKRTMPQGAFCALAAAPFVLIAIQSLIAGANANWAATTYVTAIPPAVREIRERWPRLMLWLSFLLAGAVQLLVWALLLHPAAADPLELGNVFKRQEGWRDLARAVSVRFAQEPYDYVVTDNRSVTAELVYYMRPSGAKLRIWDPSVASHNQFDMTMRLTAPASRALLVLAPEGAAQVLSTFESSRFLGRVATPVGGQNLRIMCLYDARNYRGPQSAELRSRASPP